METVDLKDKIKVYPVLKTGKRWPHRHAGEPEYKLNWNLFKRFPDLKDISSLTASGHSTVDIPAPFVMMTAQWFPLDTLSKTLPVRKGAPVPWRLFIMRKLFNEIRKAIYE